MYKAIIFDLDNTLLDYTYSEAECMRRTVREHNLNLDDEASWNKFWPAYLGHNFRHGMDFVHKRGSHQTIEEVLIHSFRDTISLHDSAYEKLSATYWNHFCNTSLSDDYHGAQNAGIDFCFYNRRAVSVSDEIKPTYMIESLKDLISVIKRK